MTTKISTNEISSNSITADLLHTTAITDKLGYTPANANNLSATSITSNNTSVVINDTGINSNIEFTVDGTKALIFTGTALLPYANVTYDLGSLTKQWKDIYVGPGSLYVNGQKVLQESSGTIIVSADRDQNMRISTSGDGNIELDPADAGSILLQGPVQLQAGQSFASSDGNGIKFSNPINVDTITSKSVNTNLTISANGAGIVSVSDDLTVTGNLTVQGSAVNLSVTSLSIEDNIIDLSSETTGTPTQNAGIRVIRGDEPAVQLRWNETTDTWQFTTDGVNYNNIVDSSVTTSASAYANTGITLAQAAYNQGNSTAIVANNKYSTTGGNITGNVTIANGKDLTVTGDLYVTGNTYASNTQAFVTNDPLLVLGLGNYTSDGVDIGFASHYNDGSNAHTGLIRDAGTKEYYFFKGYTPELDTNNNVNINDASFITANVNAGFFKGNVIADSVNLGIHVQSAFDKANTGVNNAASASSYANTGINNAASASSYANTGINNAASASSYANTAATLAQAAYNQANTANSNASGGGSSAKFFGFTLSEDKTELIMEYGTEDYIAADYVTWTVSPTTTFTITNNNLVNQL